MKRVLSQKYNICRYPVHVLAKYILQLTRKARINRMQHCFILQRSRLYVLLRCMDLNLSLEHSIHPILVQNTVADINSLFYANFNRYESLLY